MNITFLTGAGISRESGIPTYRDTDGIWSKYDPSVVCSIEGFEKCPEKCNEFFNEARAGMINCKPNLAHELIAKLEAIHTVNVITQNVDNLHEKAGSTNVIHVHGELMYDRFPNGKIYYSEGVITDHTIRPNIVMFGEDVKFMHEAIYTVKQSDIVVVVGTSLEVYPFSTLINHINIKSRKFIVDPELKIKDFKIFNETATVGVHKLFDYLNFDSIL